MEDNHSIFENFHADVIEISNLQKFGINFTDIVIEIAFYLAFLYLTPKDFILKLLSPGPYMKYVVCLCIIMLYRLTSIVLFGKTIGMAICKSKYLNKRFEPLSLIERLSIVFVPRVFGVKYYKN